MNAPINAKPTVRCLIARKLPNGSVGRSQIVNLGTAYLAMKCGSYVVLGPDPDDMDALARWERAQAQPFNGLRLP